MLGSEASRRIPHCRIAICMLPGHRCMYYELMTEINQISSIPSRVRYADLIEKHCHPISVYQHNLVAVMSRNEINPDYMYMRCFTDCSLLINLHR